VVDGWQQGWLVPAGVSGELVLRFGPDRPYRLALLYGAIALAVLLVAALIPQRPQRRPGAHAVAGRGGSGGSAEVLLATVGGVALLSVGGLVSVALALLGVLAVALWRVLRPRLVAVDQWRRRRAVRSAEWLLPGALFAVAGWVSLNDGARWSAPVPYVVALAAATVLWLSMVVRLRRTRGRAAQR
jgi:arabinofuranan 3-O-arabinosyltransferase